jgi:hypothetical protein
MDGERLENVSRECPPLDWCRSRQRTLNPSRTLQKSMLALDEIIRVQLKPGVGFGVPDQFENVVFLANDFGDFRSVDVANAIPPLTLEVQCCVMKDHESGSESDQDTQDKGYRQSWGKIFRRNKQTISEAKINGIKPRLYPQKGNKEKFLAKMRSVSFSYIHLLEKQNNGR